MSEPLVEPGPPSIDVQKQLSLGSMHPMVIGIARARAEEQHLFLGIDRFLDPRYPALVPPVIEQLLGLGEEQVLRGLPRVEIVEHQPVPVTSIRFERYHTVPFLRDEHLVIG
jgi:hypothetical protein